MASTKSDADLQRVLRDEIAKSYEKPTNLKVNEIGFERSEGQAYYVVFDWEEEEEDFCYALIDSKGRCTILDDGEDLIKFYQALLERKRSLLQRINEFDFNDLIGAFIAVAVVGSFVWLVIRTPNGGPDRISKEFLAIVSIVLGYYFGRNPGKLR